jgi:hypothetical protein
VAIFRPSMGEAVVFTFSAITNFPPLLEIW